MKAEKTRKFIERNISIDKALGIKSGEHLYGLKAELDEIERLAEIGRATEKWFDNDGSLYDTENDVEIHSSNSLLDWAKED